MSEDEDFLVEDSTFTFRVNAKLKEQFSKLCKSQRMSPSTAIKLYMEDSISEGYARLSQSSARSRANNKWSK